MIWWIVVPLLLLGIVVPVLWLSRYLGHVRRRRQWWLEHPEAVEERGRRARG